MNRIFACTICEYLIYGDHVVCLFSVFASLKYIFFRYCSAPTDILRIELSWHLFRQLKNDLSQNHSLDFVVVFLCTTFIFLSLRGIVSSGGENIFRFLLFELVLGVFFVFIFWCFLKCYPL